MFRVNVSYWCFWFAGVFFVDVRSLCRSNLYMTAYVACMFGVRVCDFDDCLINMLEPKRVLVASALRYSYCRTFTHRCCCLSSACLCAVLCMCVRTLIVFA